MTPNDLVPPSLDVAGLAFAYPDGHQALFGVDFTVDRYRETRTTAIMLWEQPFDRVLPKWLPRVDVPALIVWGDEDRLIPAAMAPAWAALLPSSTVATFPDAGHLVLDESADAVAAVGRFCAP